MSMRKKIVFLEAETLGDTSLQPIADLGELVSFSTSTRQEAISRVADADIIIVNKVRVDAELLDAAPRCRLVCEAATGVNNIDLPECERRGILVRNVAAYSTESVLQATFMHILSLVLSAPEQDAYVKSGQYSSTSLFTNVSFKMMELSGKTIGIIGMGTIGSRVAQVATAFGMHVIYYSTSGTGHCTLYPSVSLEELLRSSDIISVHAPLNERTLDLIGERELRLVRPTTYIVNMGRGGIINENALASAIDEGRLAGAALDVYVQEPLPQDSPLLHTRHMDRLRFTPHTAWGTHEARERLVEAIARNISSVSD